MVRGGYVYIICNVSNSTLYTGVTSNLISRIYQHKTKFYPNSFSARYNCNKLVYYEGFSQIEEAIEKERLLKAGSRIKKVELVENLNPNWKDLYPEILELVLD